MNLFKLIQFEWDRCGKDDMKKLIASFFLKAES